MALEKYERSLSLSTLYRIGKTNTLLGFIGPQGLPNLSIEDGTVDVYGSNSATQPATLADMRVSVDTTGVYGVVPFGVVPKWIAIVQNSGTTNEVVSYGIDVQNFGAIA